MFPFLFLRNQPQSLLKQKDDSFYKLCIVWRKEGEGGVGKEKDEPVFSRSLCLEEASRNFSCVFRDFFFSWIGSTWAFPGPLRDGRGPVLDRGYCCKWLLLQQLDLYLKREGGVVFVNTSLASRIAASASSGFC